MTTSAPTPLAWGLLCLLGLIWGGSFLGVEMALTGFGPLSVAAGRILIAAIILGVVARLRGIGMPSWTKAQGRRVWLHCLGMALLSNAVPFSLLSWGQQQVTSGFAGVSMAVVPLLILPLAHVFVPGERMSLRKVTGFAIGFVGVVTLLNAGAAVGGGDAGGAWPAKAACIAASCCYACGAIITRLTPPVPSLAFAAAGLGLATLFILPLAFFVDGIPDQIPPAQALAGLAYLGVFPTALATILLVTLIRNAGPSFLGLVNYQVPVWAVLIGALVLSEPVPPQFLMALTLILLGLAVARPPSRAVAAP